VKLAHLAFGHLHSPSTPAVIRAVVCEVEQADVQSLRMSGRNFMSGPCVPGIRKR